MNSGKNGHSTARNVIFGAVAALAVVVLILFATGRLDGFFSADELIYNDNSSQTVSDSVETVNSGIAESVPNSDDSAYNSESSDVSFESSDASSESSAANSESAVSDSDTETAELHFRSNKLLEQHFQKHGIDMGFGSAEEYEKSASAVVSNPEALHKIEAEDGDDVYYIERTNEFVVVSTDGFLRTYFNPDRGKDYFDRQ